MNKACWHIEYCHFRPISLCNELQNVWLSAVKSSHTFLMSSDIEKLKPLVLEAIQNIQHLLVAYTDENIPIGFMGIDYVDSMQTPTYYSQRVQKVLSNKTSAIKENQKRFKQVTKIEMLFIEKDFQGLGIGKKFLDTAKNNFNAFYVDVNEQNPFAHTFYLHCGFSQFARSEFDDLGNPFPLLHLEYID